MPLIEYLDSRHRGFRQEDFLSFHFENLFFAHVNNGPILLYILDHIRLILAKFY